MSEKSAKGKKRSVWPDADALVLLELWAERAIDLRRSKRNGHIYKDISDQMQNKFSAEEVHTKIRNFTQKYRDEKKEMGPSGGSPSNWKFFNAVHQIIGKNASNFSEIFESFLLENSSDASCQPSPLTSQLPSESPSLLASQSPSELPSTSSSSSPPCSAARSLSSAAPDPSSSAKKRNHLGEMVKMMREQNQMIKKQNVLTQKVVENTQSLSAEIVDAIKEQNTTSQQFLKLMETLVNKI